MIPSLEVVSLDGYQAVKTNNSAVAVVVYELDENGLLDKVGLITEKNPHFKNGTFSSLVMGKVESEDTSLFHRARIETLEEAGYEVEDPERWSFLGELYTSKIIVEPLYCYAVDITGISQGKINGDGSDQEKSLQFELVALSKIQEVNDSVFLSCVFKLFTNLYKNDLNNGIA
jgi:8-oxo-dGTP pyrophosphatase MutT (NUDIX family)